MLQALFCGSVRIEMVNHTGYYSSVLCWMGKERTVHLVLFELES